MHLGQDAGSTPYVLKRPVVLVIEDDGLLALDLEHILTEAGHEVVLAADSQRALACAADPGLCLQAAVVDLHLSFGLEGREIIRHLRSQHPGLPMVVVTGYSPAAPQADLRGLGGPTARLQKPVQPARLLQRLADAMVSRSGVA